MTEQIKTCTNPACGKTLPATTEFFGRAKNYKNGLRSVCLSCHRAAGRAYMAKWALEHPEKKKARAAAYYAENSAGQIAYSAAYAAANPEKVRASRKASEDAHPETLAQWKKNNPNYPSWKCMIQRCYNPKNASWSRYGGANPPITVCERWRDPENGYENFCADMGPKPTPEHTLGRYLDIGNYGPGNVAWQTWAEQGADQKGKTAMLKYRQFRLTAVVAA